MKLAMIVSLIGVFAMAAVLIYAFINGDFLKDGKDLLSNPWGVVSLVDLYVGFALFSGWIIYREDSLPRSVVWVFFMMVSGFFTGALYTFIALRTSEGDWRRFLMGKRADRNDVEQR